MTLGDLVGARISTMSGPWILSKFEAAVFFGLVLAMAGAATLATAGVI
jgi:hypothetical protein